MHCPLCGYPIEDSTRATCPRCFAELSPPAASEAVPSASPSVPPLPPPLPPTAFPPVVSPAASMPARVPPANPRRKFWMIGIAVVLLPFVVLFCTGLIRAMGNYQKQQTAQRAQLQHDLSTPVTAAEAILSAFRKHDFERVYYVSEFKDIKKKSAIEARGFALGSRLSLLGEEGEEYRKFIAAITATRTGKAVYNGFTADVPVMLTYTFEGEKYPVKGVAHLVQRDGFWRFDLTGMGLETDSPEDEAAFDKAFSDLLGLDDPVFQDEETDTTEEKP